MRQLFERLFVFVLTAFMVTACQTANFGAEPQSSSLMLTSNAQVAPPTGFISFCLRNPDQCAAPAEQPQFVKLNQATWDTIRFVNSNINRTVRFEDDFRHYGRPEYWTLATDGYGDCDDYALTKRKALIDAGLPALALRIAVVRTLGNVGHAVLTITTDQGDYVLDNLTTEILPWDKARLIWISRQDTDNPMIWVSLRTITASLSAESSSFDTLASR